MTVQLNRVVCFILSLGVLTALLVAAAILAASAGA
jgi:hypothetical protein